MTTAVSGARELIHPRVRMAFLEAVSDWGVARKIETDFEDEGIDQDPDTNRDWYVPGQRRGTFDRYVATVHWTDPSRVRQVLNLLRAGDGMGF